MPAELLHRSNVFRNRSQFEQGQRTNIRLDRVMSQGALWAPPEV